MKNKLRITPDGKLRQGGVPVFIKVDGVVIGMVVDGIQPSQVIYVRLDQLKMVP